MLDFSKYLYESLDDMDPEESSLKLSDKDKKKLLELDNEYNECYKLFRSDWKSNEVENADEEFKKFMEARKEGKKYYPQLKQVGDNKFEVDHLQDRIKDLIEEFKKFDCFLSKYYIEILEPMVWKIDFSLDTKKYAEKYTEYQGQTPSKREYNAAMKMLKENPYEVVSTKDRNIDAKEAAKQIQQYINDMGYGWKVKISDTLMPRMGVHCDKTMDVKSTAKFSKTDIEGLKWHEVRGHIARRYYGLKTGLYLFLYGLLWKNDLDEGLAIWNSLNKCSKPKPNIKFNIALKTIICYHLKDKDFCELFDMCRELDKNVPDKALFKTICRFKRELQDCSLLGGNGDDQSYFCGYQMVDKMDDKTRDDILKYNIGPGQIDELDKIKEFLKVNKFKSLI